MASKVKFFDAFCGAGGLSYGLQEAGWKPVGGFDYDFLAALTYEVNLGASAIVADAFETDPKFFAELYDADAVVGCPPCQGFSSLKVSRFGKGDRRNDLVSYFRELVRVFSPSIVVFENVPGVRRDPRFKKLVEFLRSEGFDVAWSVLNAADYGVPQKRRRLVLVAVDGGEAILPEPEYGHPNDKEVIRGERKPWKTVRDAIGDLPPIGNGEACGSDELHVARRLPEHYIRLIERIPADGGTRFDAPRELWLPSHRRAGNKYPDVFARLKWDEPSPTITTGFTNPSKGRFTHPEQNRGLSLREGARLQTFPDDFVFSGTFARIEKQIGEAFPPLLAEKIAESLK